MKDTPEPSTWSVGGRSVMGAAHVHGGVPNQDAIRWRAQGDAGAILALADGHGAAMHFRSGIGAHIAVETAVDVLSAALADPAWIAASDTKQAHKMVAAILARWRQSVSEHVVSAPLGASVRDPFVPYGSTLIAALACPSGIVVLQLGDGDLLLGLSDGRFLRPLPDDKGMVGQQTYSLCQPDAARHFRVRIIAAPDHDAIELVMLSTDGLAKSFADQAAFEQIAASWRQAIAESGLETLCDGLDRRLSEISHHGSGDDITLGFLVRPPTSPGAERAARAAQIAELSSDKPRSRTAWAKLAMLMTTWAAIAAATALIVVNWPR